MFVFGCSNERRNALVSDNKRLTKFGFGNLVRWIRAGNLVRWIRAGNFVRWIRAGDEVE